MHHAKNGTKLQDLEFFLAVAEKLRFGEAAKRLGVPASTLSRRIAALEAALGQRLLQRTSRSVGLTSDGAQLFARSRGLMEELREVLDDTDSEAEPTGKLRVTAPLLTGSERVAPALFAFAERYPRVELELRLTNAIVDLVEDGFDLAFRLGPIKSGDLVARRLWSAPYMIAASPRVVRETLHGATSLSRRALAAQPFVLTRTNGEVKLVRRDGTVEVVKPPARVVVNDPRMAVAAALAGLGLVCAPRDMLAKEGKGLVELSVRGRQVLPREIYAVYPSRRFLPARVRLALDWVREHAANAA
jgi:DNA-binding transcriptional LysR family regulator